MIIQKMSHNLKLISIYNNVPFIFECFMTYNTPSGLKKAGCQIARWPKSSSSSSSMMMHFTYTEQHTSPSLFHNFKVKVSRGGSNW